MERAFLVAESELDAVSKSLIELSDITNIIVFRGELGAGKTTLIKNICNFLNVKDEVNSPTFSIVNEYLAENNVKVYHFDFYRIEEEEEAYDIGVEDYFYSNTLCLIEWPSKIESLLPENRIEVSIAIVGNKREFTIKSIQ